MKSKLLILLVIVLLVFSAGCVSKENIIDITKGKIASATAENTSAVENETSAEEPVENETESVNCTPYYTEYLEHLESGFSQAAAVALTHECVETYDPENPPVYTESSDDIEGEVLSYIQDNPIAQFETLSDRILTGTKTSKLASVTYRTSTTAPGPESVYLCGVLLILYPNIDEVDVKGYNQNSEEMEAAKKTFKRNSYNFNNYKIWFPDYTYSECTENSDCDDSDATTVDTCASRKCNNVAIADS